MSQISREHLIDGFAQEMQFNIPNIRKNLAALNGNPTNWQNLEQVYRLFHNIKGSSAQLSLNYISGAARIAEDLLEELLINGKDIRNESISFIDTIAKEIHKLCKNEQIKDNEIAEQLLTDTIIGFRKLTGKTSSDPHEVDENIKIVLNGESIIEKPSLKTPEECLKKSLSILELLQSHTGESDYSVQTAFLLNELCSYIHRYVETSGHGPHSQLETFSESLIEFFFWLSGEPASRTAQVTGLIENYLHFLEILANNQGLVDPGKIDSVAQTMIKVQRLSAAADTDIGMSEPAPADDFSGNQDFLLTEDDLLDPVEEIDFEDDFLLEDPFQTSHDEECAPEQQEAGPADASGLSDEETAELHEIFLLECEEHLSTIGQTLDALEQRVHAPSPLDGEIEQNMHDMRRAIHTLKGAAAMTGFSDLSALAHNCEDLLDTIFETSGQVYPSEIKALADSAGMIEVMARTPDKADPEDLSRIVAVLHSAQVDRIEADDKGDSDQQPGKNNDADFVEWDDEDLFTVQDSPEEPLEPDVPETDTGSATLDESAELQDIFLAECEEHLHMIGKALTNLEQQVLEPSMLSGSIEMNLSNMRRAIHTLKGAAGMIGFLELSSFAHSCEDLLDTIFEASDKVYPAEISILADSVDMIEIMARTPDKTDSDRLTRLDALLHSAQASRTGQDTAAADSALQEEDVESDTSENTGPHRH